MKRWFAILILVLLAQAVGGKMREYKPAPADNPLKGLVPYAIEWKKDRFPHSMEFSYIPMDALMTGWVKYDWEPLEKILEETRGRGKQSIFRIYLEYPKKKSALPKFLQDDGVKITKWKSEDGLNFTPDYEEPKLRRAMKEFIAAMGKKYDGDPRIGFITMGMLGLWGEWHNFPRQELLASKEVQKEVMKSFDDAFSKTHILMRYPAGEGNYHYADNRQSNVGYHDDSFGWATLDTGKNDDSWFFVPSMKAAGSPPAEPEIGRDRTRSDEISAGDLGGRSRREILAGGWRDVSMQCALAHLHAWRSPLVQKVRTRHLKWR